MGIGGGATNPEDSAAGCVGLHRGSDLFPAGEYFCGAESSWHGRAPLGTSVSTHPRASSVPARRMGLLVCSEEAIYMRAFWELLVFRRMISPIILQVLFWGGIGGTLYGTYVLVKLDNWA